MLLQIIILHPATLNSSRLFRFIELRRCIFGLCLTTPSKKGIFTPVFAQI
jgi:hypothetical protein